MGLKCVMAAAAASLFLPGCRSDNAKQPSADALVWIKGEELTRAQLRSAMPAALSEEDSVKYARAYIKSWISQRAISSLGAEDVDMDEIDRLVEQYRRELIMNEYTKRLCEEKVPAEVPEDSLMAYYEAHKGEYLLSSPMIKGVYVKIASDSQSLPQLRNLYRSHSESDIDKLDKSLLNGAIHYEYFRDQWVDWEQVERRIPYDFGASADAFLKGHSHVDATADGYTYLLDISDVLHTGETMPFEAARQLIIERLNYIARRQYQEAFKKKVFDEGVADGSIKVMCEL